MHLSNELRRRNILQVLTVLFPDDFKQTFTEQMLGAETF